MKQSCFYIILLSIGLGGLLVGCKERVDLANIDTRSELSVGIALPIGSMRMTIEDLMLNKTMGTHFYIAQDGTLTFRDTSHIKRDFHKLDWKDYISSSSKKFNMPEPGTIVGPATHTFSFDFDLKLNHINTDLANERFDSVLVDMAQWNSNIRKQNMEDLQWDWIDKIDLDLGSQCYREAGNIVNIYTKGNKDYDFDYPIPTNIDQFSLCMMRDRTLSPDQNTLDEFDNNVVDAVNMQLQITIAIPEGATLTIGDNSAILYDIDFQILKHKAIWGHLRPDKNLKFQDTVDIAKELNLGPIKNLQLPLSSPELKFDIRTQVAAYFDLNCISLYSFESKTKTKAYATFNGDTTYVKHFKDNIGLAPSSIGKDAEYSITLNNTDSLGHIDQCFSIKPDLLIYNFAIDLWDPQHHPQLRIPSTPAIDLDLIASFPLSFNQMVDINFMDTIKDVNLSRFSLDSLLASVKPIEKVKSTSIFLVLNAHNDMPLSVIGTFHFKDANGEDLQILEKPLSFTAKDSVSYTFEIYEKDFDKLAATKNIFVDIDLNDQPLQGKPELYPIRLEQDQALRLQLGFAGNIDAVFNFNKDK